jgi:hypothetical protein
MRLFGVSMVRNEADIVEAYVRHNLTVLDGLVVVDHASIDETADILVRLVAEGLPVRVIRDSNAGFFQAEWLTAIARETFQRDGADFVFPLDADEFIKASSRQDLERELSDLPARAHAAVHWLTYVPESLDGRPFGESHLRWRLKVERHGNHKCVIGRSFAERRAQYIVSGNHLVDDLAAPSPPPHVRLRPPIVAIAHCPVRSGEQIRRKVTLGYSAHLATQPGNDKQAFHWRELYEELSDGEGVTDARLRQIACNYGVPKEKWQPVEVLALVDDPVLLVPASRDARQQNR